MQEKRNSVDFQNVDTNSALVNKEISQVLIDVPDDFFPRNLDYSGEFQTGKIKMVNRGKDGFLNFIFVQPDNGGAAMKISGFGTIEAESKKPLAEGDIIQYESETYPGYPYIVKARPMTEKEKDEEKKM